MMEIRTNLIQHEKIGYVRWLSNDWKLIKELLKHHKTSVEQKQRQKLNLEK